MESGCTPHMGPIYIASWEVAKLVIIIAIHLRMATIGHLWTSVCCHLRVRLGFPPLVGWVTKMSVSILPNLQSHSVCLASNMFTICVCVIIPFLHTG